MVKCQGTKGYFGMGIYSPKNEINVGVLWRSAHIFGAAYIFTIGRRYKQQHADTTKAWKSIPLFEYKTFEDFSLSIPKQARLVAAELALTARPIKNFCHPKQAIYLLGAEDHGIPGNILKQCHDVVQLPGNYCLNVATVGSILMYDRINKFE